MGLHSGKAWIKLNGRVVKLKPGEVSHGGLHLYKASNSEILVNINGKQYKYIKGKRNGIPWDESLVVKRDRGSGSYVAKGAINNKKVTFIIDTGATFVTLSNDLARKLGIRIKGEKVRVNTATKQETAYLVQLDSVQVGGIALSNIKALITRHNYPANPLLGMSFLSKLEMSQKDNQMFLRYSN